MAARVRATGVARFPLARRLATYVSHALEHPRIDEAGRQMILADVLDAVVTASQPRQRWAALLNLPQTWGTIVAKGLTDPV